MDAGYSREPPPSGWLRRGCFRAEPFVQATALSSSQSPIGDVAQQLDGLSYALEGIDQGILVLDREHVIVAGHPQRHAKLAPPFLAMSEAERDIVPASRRNLARRARLENAIDPGRDRLDARVLGMHIVDRTTQGPYRGEGIGAHPDGMARIVVCADDIADRVAQALERVRIVDGLVAMEFQADAPDPVVPRNTHEIPPVWNDALVPLVLQDAATL